jgi:hypothetical protein
MMDSRKEESEMMDSRKEESEMMENVISFFICHFFPLPSFIKTALFLSK